jgi:hypothetical protein
MIEDVRKIDVPTTMPTMMLTASQSPSRGATGDGEFAEGVILKGVPRLEESLFGDQLLLDM